MNIIIKRSHRARTVRIVVQAGGTVVVIAPYSVNESLIAACIHKHTHWIQRSVARMCDVIVLPQHGRRAYLKHKDEARDFVYERLRYWNQFYRHSYQGVSIKNTRSLWGSCSRKANLNFSYKLLFLPHELSDYVVVHELCHLKEHNHGPRFWRLVERTIPDYKERRTLLRRYKPVS